MSRLKPPPLACRQRPSPNFGSRPDGATIDMLILHYTGMTNAEAALARLCDPAAQVSCHWLIEEDGTVWLIVPEEFRAWHAGASYWRGETDINSRSIGIELVNPGHELGYRAFPQAQMAALVNVSRAILARHPIPPNRVLGHSDVAPRRKSDPGERFDWTHLAAHGIGLWPEPSLIATECDPAEGLARIGYEVGEAGADPALLTAFQRHFRPGLIDGFLDAETRRRIAQTAAVFAAGAIPLR
jgi:N-acetylmuramoyl-L-alanine amidase